MWHPVEKNKVTIIYVAKVVVIVVMVIIIMICMLLLQSIQSTAANYYHIRKIVTIISLHLGGPLQLAKHTPYRYLDDNISHDWYLAGALKLMKQIRI